MGKRYALHVDEEKTTLLNKQQDERSPPHRVKRASRGHERPCCSPVRRSHFLRLPAGREKSLAALVPAMRASYFLASLASPPHSASALPNSFLAVVSSLLRCVHLTCARWAGVRR